MSNQELLKLIDSIKSLCVSKNIPISRDRTINFIQDTINKKRYQTILEIGTAYGYSASCMMLCDSVNKIVTIEKNISNFTIAESFLKSIKEVTCVNQDAFDYEPLQKFDFIFIDGSKSHQDKLLLKYLTYLNPNGCIMVDNIFLKKFNKQDALTRNQKKLIDKVNQFRT
jgi:predicted O-methyltransferase YrrM